MFHIGQRVVCVDATDGGGCFPPTMDGLLKGAVYTVRWAGLSVSSREAIRVEEITRTKLPGTDHEVGFLASRFRPVDETRLEVFRQMLAPTPRVKEPA